MKYFVCKHADIDALCRHVNQLIDEGWKPQGGISMCDVPGYNLTNQQGWCWSNHSIRHYAQAMVRDSSFEPLKHNSG